MEHRRPSAEEIALIEFLIMKSKYKIRSDWKDQLMVASMDDGGMGSLKLIPLKNTNNNPSFGNQVAEYRFKDADGIEVLVSLNVDQFGNLFELDIWKTNYGKLIRLPDVYN